jgi:hypothetical protein
VDFLHKLLLFIHLVGLAAVLGGALVQVAEPQRSVTPMVLHGAGTQLLSGILLVGVLEADDVDVNHPKFGVKLTVALVIVVLTEIYRRRDRLPDAAFFGILGLTLGNVGVAVFWT